MNPFLNKSEQGIIIFRIFPHIKYPLRLSLSALLIISGFAIQFYMYHFFPGIIFILAGNLLLLVKGCDNRLKMGSYKHSAWERLSKEQMENIVKLHKKMTVWDRSLWDISNAIGFWFFVIILIIIVLLFLKASYYSQSYYILAINLIVLLLPHWFTGLRKILTFPVLLIKIKLIDKVILDFQKVLENYKIEYLALLRGEKKSKRLPYDIKFKVSKPDAPEGFLGLYGQTTINNVGGTMYPYFYVVLVCKPEFELINKTKNYKPGTKNIIKEYKHQDGVDVIVIRQFTTRTSGYHTKEKIVNEIFEEGLKVCKMLLS